MQSTRGLAPRGLARSPTLSRERRNVRRGVARGIRVLALESLVAPVVRRALGEVRAVRRLDHAVHHEAVDQQRVQRAFLQEVLGAHQLLAAHEAALRQTVKDAPANDMSPIERLLFDAMIRKLDRVDPSYQD